MRRFVLAAVTSVGLASTATGLAAEAAAPVEKVTITNKVVDGKKVWLPGDIHAKVGTELDITLVNTLADPHGFNIPGLVDNVVVVGNETKVVKAVVKNPGIYKFSCQLHPAHVGGQIVVK